MSPFAPTTTKETTNITRDPELQRLVDESSIRKLLNSYARATDRVDHELLRSLYHEDAHHEDAHHDAGNTNGPVENYLAMWETMARNKPRTSRMHHNTTMLIEIDGDTAWTGTYCLAILREPASEERSARDRFLRIRYVDRIERRAGEWKIAHRKMVWSPGCVNDVVKDGPFGPDFIVETQDRTDPAYSRSK